MKQKRKAIWVMAGMLSGISLLSGCGGGSSGTRQLSGVFVDAPVAGLEYQTPTGSGVTDTNGRFSYAPGETVSFSIGGLLLGESVGKPEVSLLDMSELSSLPSGEEAIFAALRDAELPGPLNRVINMAVLLQSLDIDANAENGIAIDAAVARRIASAAIDLNSFYYDFADDGNIRNGRGLRALLRAAEANGELSARPVVHPALALGHFYEQLGVVPGVWSHLAERGDSDADGAVDYLTEYRYNVSGAYLGSRSDDNADGAYERSNEYQLGGNLETLMYSRDDDADGSAEQVTRRTYDEFGALLTSETTDSGGTVTAFERLEFDTLGRLLRREVRSSTSHIVQYWIVDDAGLRSTYEVDEDGDGAIDTRSILGFGDNQRSDWWVTRDNDTNLDGVPDSRQTRRLDAQGRVLSSVRDDDLDGNPDYWVEQDFDSKGRLLRYARDSDGTGIDYQRLWTISDDGLRISSETDQDGDGVFERADRQTYSSAGVRLSVEVDDDLDGQFEVITRYSYDSSGRSTGNERLENGVLTRSTQRLYDPQGRLIRTDVDSNGDGLVDRIETFEDYQAVGFAGLL